MHMPAKAKKALKDLGQQIRFARKRRLWTIAELAERIEVSSPTIMALEKGTPTVSIGTVAAVLWTLGLESELQLLANPIDTLGIELMDARLPKKIKTKKQGLDNDF